MILIAPPTVPARQRAMAAAKLANLEWGSNRFQKIESGAPDSTHVALTQTQAAKLFGVHHDSVSAARTHVPLVRSAKKDWLDAVVMWLDANASQIYGRAAGRGPVGIQSFG